MDPKRVDGKVAASARATRSSSVSTRAAKTTSPLARAGPPKKPKSPHKEACPISRTNATRPKSAPNRPTPPHSRDEASTRHSDDSNTQKSTGSPARWPRPKSSQRRGSGSRRSQPVSASRISPIHHLSSDDPGGLPFLTVMPAADEWLRCTLLAPAWVAVRLGVVAGPQGTTLVHLAACHAVAGMWGSCRADAARHPAAPAWLRRGATPSCTGESGVDGSGGGGGTGDPDADESGRAASGGRPSELPLSSVEQRALRLLFKGCDAVTAQLLPPARPGAHGARAEHVLVCEPVEKAPARALSRTQSRQLKVLPMAPRARLGRLPRCRILPHFRPSGVREPPRWVGQVRGAEHRTVKQSSHAVLCIPASLHLCISHLPLCNFASLHLQARRGAVTASARRHVACAPEPATIEPRRRALCRRGGGQCG